MRQFEGQWSRTTHDDENANEGTQRFIFDHKDINFVEKLHPSVQSIAAYLVPSLRMLNLSHLSAYVAG